MLCTIYNDGSHYIAYQKVKSKYDLKKERRRNDDLIPMEQAFDELYFLALKENLSLNEQKSFVRKGIVESFGDAGEILDKWLEQKFDVKLKNIALRKKRFRRKAFLNNWNYFVTFTYDDKKQTEESFRKKLRKCLSNFCSRRSWKMMGIWEYGAEEKRLHFHALLYVPEGQMVGTIDEKKEYSKRKHKLITRHENNFFTKFGRNDFAYLTKNSLSKGRTLDYILKYITKTNERIVYSRGIPSEFVDEIFEEDVVCEMEDFVLKYVLFDDVFDDENCRVLKSIEFVEYCGFDISEVCLE